MTIMDEQKCEFEQRRLAVMRKHLDNDPKLKAIKRKRKRAVFTSFIGSFMVIGVVLILIKAFVIANEGQQGYARMVAPALQGQAEGSILDLMLRPDPISTDLAAAIAPILPRQSAAPAAQIMPLEQILPEGMMADQP